MNEVPVEITLRYMGNAVDSGTMPISDVISALQGFSGAYGRIAARTTPGTQHEIRVADINKSSFAVVVLAWAWASAHKELLTGASSAVIAVTGLIIKLIDLKKKNRGKEPTVQINGDGNIVLMGDENTQVVMSKELYDVFKTKALDSELAKLARPLEENAIDRVELSARDTATGQTERTEISFSDKLYFQGEESTTVTSKPVRLNGMLISLNKETNRGSFRMQNGNTVRYHLSGSDSSSMQREFLHKGPVQVECVASFDEDLEVRSIEVTSITPLQSTLQFEATTEHPPSQR